MAKSRKPDLQFANLISFASCYALTRKGASWLKRNIDLSEATTANQAVFIEFRYLPDIVNGARADGLVCRG